jgi:hypothetical protein
MRRVLLAAMLALCPSLVSAAPAKVAIIYDSIHISGTGASSGTFLSLPTILTRMGIPYDTFDAGDSARFGGSAIADSTWFRQNYSCVFIYAAEIQDGGTRWYSHFRDELNATGVAKSPISGNWGMPVYGFAPGGVQSGGALQTGSASRPGWASTGSGTVYGTWGYRALSRLRGQTADTLYASMSTAGCRTTAFGSTLAALAYVDTVNTGSACAAGDTIMFAWRYKPGAGPGIIWVTMNGALGSDNARSASTGPALLVQYALTQCPDLRGTKIPISIYIDHGEPGRLDATGVALSRDFTQTFKANGFKGYSSILNSPCETGNKMATTEAWSHWQSLYLDGTLRWGTHSHGTACSGADWRYAHYAAADTIGVALRLNRTIQMSIHPDTCNLRMRDFSQHHIGCPSDEAPKWAMTALYKVGTRVMRGDGRASATPSDEVYHNMSSAALPFWSRAPGQGAMWSIGIWNLPLGDTWTLTWSGSEWNWLGRVGMSYFEDALLRAYGMWFHGDDVTGGDQLGLGTSTDAYGQWLFSGPFPKWFGHLNRVVEVNGNSGVPLKTHRNTFTART